jgi:hypothetical protein
MADDGVIGGRVDGLAGEGEDDEEGADGSLGKESCEMREVGGEEGVLAEVELG